MYRPAYFASLTVRELSGFRGEQTLDLRGPDGRPAKWTLLVGDHASAQTRLLQCLDHMSPYAWHHSSQSPGRAGGTGPRGLGRALAGLPRAGAEACELRSEVILDQAFSSYEERAALRRDFRLTVRGAEVEGIRYSTPFAMHCCGYGPGRRPGDGAEMSELSATLHDAVATLPAAEQWLLQLDAAARANRALRDRCERVKRLLIDILPGVDDLRIVGVENNAPAVELHGADGWFAPGQVSREWQATAAWIVDLAGRMITALPGSRDPLREATVALIDTIELHVEPGEQAALIERLDRHFPNVQFIASTRSAAVIAAAPGANVVALQREGDAVVIAPPSRSRSEL